MWKMDFVQSYKNKLVKLNHVDHEIVSEWLDEHNYIIKYDYKNNAYYVTNGNVTESQFIDLVIRVGATKEKLSKLVGE
tara:strand:- start:809 stop:1042 length:234 start_codon:yes stop_codon:yes gene_type:complete